MSLGSVQAPAPAGTALVTAGFWLRVSSVLLPGSVAKVEPCLVVAVPATSCAWQADNHMPEGLQGVVRKRQTSYTWFGSCAAQAAGGEWNFRVQLM